ncbi:hypothetical protein Glove_59g45 [Diversispora epigaea]|uniref:Uncharacterized protein n=1 Tax=Diversispora epigaea TaxID=1348612 RepID=A0A397JC20_9GLOM|nr:hypothetical protein Glove_59g45 [Diversispora epigaea]
MYYGKKFESSNYNYEWQPSKLCNRCGRKPEQHKFSANVDKKCDYPRYVENNTRRCGCKRTPIYEMALRQKDERDPDYRMNTHCCFCKKATRLVDLKPLKLGETWYERCYGCENKHQTPIYEMALRQKDERDPDYRMNTHCCFCKKATRLVDLKPLKLGETWYERCYGCENKHQIEVPEREELYEYRGTQLEKRERSYSYERNHEGESSKKIKTTPARNVYANESTYNYQEETTNIDWANDTEKQILKKAGLDNKGKGRAQDWKEAEQRKRTEYCTQQCQFLDHKKLKDGNIHLFDVNITMIHDKRNCPYGALEYDEAGIEYEICTCYRKQSKYCFGHDHKTNPYKCAPQVFWEIKSFAGERCKWEQCMNYDEYLHCEHLYCWKHEKYWFNGYSKCGDCKKEN